ncbi:MAG: NAD(P)H-hydrate dehydratase [Deltaproteobacteria bacterium]|nr:NAD(P)H-hydrate dehydratase [Deltaproteobacteria bacterium]
MTVAMTAAQMRAYDRHAIDVCGVPGIVLMENAGRGAAERIAERMGDARGPALVLCGKGNNGGDGFVVARHLETRGLAAEVFLLGRRDDVAGDARTNLDALVRLGFEVREIEDDLAEVEAALARSSLVVDALFGTGLSRPLDARATELVHRIHASLRPVVALDVPSGIDATTGEVLGVAVHATETLTFAHLKTGLLQGEGVRHAGHVRLVGLGIPDGEVLDAVGCEAEAIEPDDVLAARGFRAPDAHKYRAGSVLVVAGSAGKSGAALLAATAALRGGAGLATVATWPEIAASLDGRVLEVMTYALDREKLTDSLDRALERRAAVCVGPGLGLDSAAREVTERIVLGYRGPAVVDADALTHFAGRPTALAGAPGPRVLTPHAGELARLLGEPVSELERDRFGAARRAAKATGAVVVFKGPHTLVAHPDGRLRYLDGAEPLLATAGSGDVLAGVVLALLAARGELRAEDDAARTEIAFEVACAAVHVHLRAARLWRERTAIEMRPLERGLVASDLVAELPRALASL